MAKKLARPRKTKSSPQKAIEPDEHKGKERLNRPSSGLVNMESGLEVSSEGLTKTASVKIEQIIISDSIKEFWGKFRLSPFQVEHVIQTDIGWLTLITLGPPILLVILSIIKLWIEQDLNVQAALSDLRDSIFIPVSLSLFFSSFIFRYRWYQHLSQTFESVLENEVLRSDEGTKITRAEFLGFLEGYRRNLHSKKRYVLPAISILINLGVALFISNSRGYWNMREVNDSVRLIEILHTSTRWILAPILWSFVGSLWFWSFLSTARAIRDLSKRFRIYIQPLHSDRAGGLKKLGDLSSSVGLLIVVAAIAPMVIAVRETVQSARVVSCGNEFRQLLNFESTMTQDRLTDCIYVLAQDGGISRAQISEYLASKIKNEFDLSEFARQYYDRFEYWFQGAGIFEIFSIIYAMDLVILISLVLALYAIIWPLLDIHYRMAEYKHKKERETNYHISVLFDELTLLIRQDEFEKADKIKAKIGFLTTELSAIQKYPTWPIRPLPVVRTYLTSSLVTALISYLFSLLQLSLSSELGAIVIEAVKSFLGD